MKALKTALVELRHPHMGKFGPETSGYIATFRQLQGVAVVAYCEDTDTALQEPAGEFHREARTYTSVDTLIEQEDFDLAVVVLPPAEIPVAGLKLAEAVGGPERARRGIQMLSFGSDWETAQGSYRMAIFGKGSLPRHGGQPYIDTDQAKSVLEGGEKLSMSELLGCRVRYFTDGAVLGSNEFVQEQFEAFRQFLGEHRKSGPRRMRGGDWGGLAVLRDLRKDVIILGNLRRRLSGFTPSNPRAR